MHVLLSPQAVSAQVLVEQIDFAGGAQPPVAALAAVPVQGVEHLIPKRASGALATYLLDHPDTSRARLERYVVVSYDPADVPSALNALHSDADIENAYVPAQPVFTVPPGFTAPGALRMVAHSQVATDWKLPLHVAESWDVAGGWALVGTVDSGIATAHPALRSFANGRYSGGNFLPALSFDVGRTGLQGCQTVGNCIEPNVDEAQPVAMAAGGACDADGNGLGTPAFAGHGTHVAGLVAANGAEASGVCRHCGLAVWRAAGDACFQNGLIRPQLNAAAIDAAITLQADIGVQVINQSFGRPSLINPTHCDANATNSECLALDYAAERGVVLVAASGNHRTSIAFPAAIPAVIAAGGLGTNLDLWNRDPDAPPNHLDGCPQPPIVQTLGQECGSNFTVNVGADRRQEVTAPAESVYSTTYPGLNWSNGLGCGDEFDGANGDGMGPCTGTSMASPIIAGIAGLLRSINPLVLPGDPESAVDAIGIRDVVTATTDAGKAGLPWSPRLGYGRPDAATAAHQMLGLSRGVELRNRAIPLFDFHSAIATDYAVTTSPQASTTLSLTERWLWTPRGPTVGGYTAFPAPGGTTVPTPRASAYVLSTEFRASSRHPPLAPLFLLNRARFWPLGCTPGASGCRYQNRDFMLVSTEAALETAVAEGYEFFGRQGYIYQRCASEPACIPAGASKLYRLCNTAEDDCAVFLEHELANFQAEGYITPYPAVTDPVMGYAYRNIDADGDTLIDGFEHLIGTNPNSVDSDGDGSPDGMEYPLAGVPVSDPCVGPAVTCAVPELLYDGFE